MYKLKSPELTPHRGGFQNPVEAQSHALEHFQISVNVELEDLYMRWSI